MMNTVMNRNQVMDHARAAGLIVKPCASDQFIAIRADKAPAETQERMRINSDGSVFTVNDGYYWAIGTVDDVARYVEGLK